MTQIQDNFDSHPEGEFENGAAYIPDGILAKIHDDYVLPAAFTDKIRQSAEVWEHTITVSLTIPIDDLVALLEKEIAERIQKAIGEHLRGMH